MARRSMLLAALAVVLACAHAPPPGPNVAAEEKALVGLEHQLLDAIRTRNPTALDALLAPDFQAFTYGEVPQNRARFSQSVLATPGTIVTLQTGELRVRVIGDTAAIMGVATSELRRGDGLMLHDRQAFTELARRVDGRWLFVLAHFVPVR